MTLAAVTTNLTPFVAGHYLLPDGEGGEQIVVLVKATLSVDALGNIGLAEPGVELRMADELRGKPEWGSPLHDGDLVLVKPRVDVLIEACAHAPQGVPTEWMLVGVEIGEVLRKQLLVSGDRAWVDEQPSRPLPFTIMPIVWERAYGGMRGRDHVDERNPIGIGHRGARSVDPEVVSLLPNIEDPSAPMLRPDSECAPVGLGVVGRAWLPRRSLAGTFDFAWRRERWPLAPVDFDPGFHQSAPRDQQLEHYPGGEVVRLVGLTPAGEWAFRLPWLDVPIALVYADRLVRVPLRVDTIEIDALCGRLILTGRVAIAVERRRAPLLEIVVGHAKPAWLAAKSKRKRHVDLRGDGPVDTRRPYLW